MPKELLKKRHAFTCAHSVLTAAYSRRDTFRWLVKQKVGGQEEGETACLSNSQIDGSQA